jgi:hypothetical protein
MTARFYTAEAETAAVVACGQGHLMARETALAVGKANCSTWACPYCLYTSGERQAALAALRTHKKENKE